MGVHNLTKGCHIVFEEAVFSGHYRNATFNGYRTIGGEIVSDSYQKNGHCFTILVDELDGVDASKYKIGQKVRRFGRNIYPNLQSVKYPDDYNEAQEEKSQRSELAKELKEVWREVTCNGRWSE